jgi:hypothetical protein
MKAGSFSLTATNSALTEYAIIVLTVASIIVYVTYELFGR